MSRVDGFSLMGWGDLCLHMMRELKRRGDARIISLGDTIRGQYGKGLMPPYGCVVGIPFRYPSKGIEHLSVSYVVYTLPTHYVRHAHIISFDAKGNPVDLKHDADFILGALQPFVSMLGFNDDHDEWSGIEECVVIHFAEKLTYPPCPGVSVCR